MYTFYFEISDSSVKNYPGKYLYMVSDDRSLVKSQQSFRLLLNSDRIWRQGPKGGVKIHRSRNLDNCSYVTNNEEIMKEFFMVKLSSIKL